MSARQRVYGRELRNAIVQALAAVPAVSLVSFLQYFGVQQYFVRVTPHTPDTIAQVDAAVHQVLNTLHPEIATSVRWRVLAPGEALPSSSVEFRREGQ